MNSTESVPGVRLRFISRLFPSSPPTNRRLSFAFSLSVTGKQDELKRKANRCCQDAKDKPGSNKLGAQSQILHMNVKEYEGAHHSGTRSLMTHISKSSDMLLPMRLTA